MSAPAQDNTASEEHQYLNLIRRILDHGTWEDGRNGRTKSVFGETMRFSLRDGRLPLLTSKKVAVKACFAELMWFVRGDVDNRILNEQGVHIWDGNASREFLDAQGLHAYPDGYLGPIYGWQWRRWNCPMGAKSEGGIDQLQQVIDALKDPIQRSSRRLLVSAWNPEQLKQMALPPCHVMMQFRVREGRHLSCAMFQRSGDVGLGVPFNIASYAMLTHLVAHHCGLEPDELVYFLGDAHIYENHVPPLETQWSRRHDLYPFPRIRFTTTHNDIGSYTWTDLAWTEPYLSHTGIPMTLVA